MTPTNNSLTLLQWYYSYFLLSLYTDVLMKEWSIPLAEKDIILTTNSQNGIKLNTKRINTILEQIQKAPNSKNVYGYLSYISSMKWLLGVFLDMHSRSAPWRLFLKKTLGNKYEAYIELIRFCRNLLTHQHTVDITLSPSDIERAKETLGNTGKRIISITFHYHDIFGSAWKWAKTYGFHVSINTSTLHTKRRLFDIIDEHTLFMLAESVYNLSEHYKNTWNTTTKN